MERKCGHCSSTVCIDRDNSEKSIIYKGKYFHNECFKQMVEEKKKNKRYAEKWAEIQLRIDDLVQDTTDIIRELVFRDEVSKWICSNYNISMIDQYVYLKLDQIYKGCFKGQAYAIGPEELLNEWKYYMNNLNEARRGKDIRGSAAINYDIAILLRWNVDYREMVQRAQLKDTCKHNDESDMDTKIIAAAQRNSTRQDQSNKRARLYEEVMGNGN